MAKEDKKEEANGFLSRFKSNMADYFKDNPNAFDFTNQGGQSTSDKVAAFTDQFSKVVLIKLQMDLVYSNLVLIL